MRQKGVRQVSGGRADVKAGLGGIRDVEFLVQGLQLVNLHACPDLLSGNTLEAIEKLVARGILAAETGRSIREDYIFMRRVEHCLQIMEDRQIHAIPEDADQLRALGKRLLGADSDRQGFMLRLDATRDRVRRTYRTHLDPHG
jgi:glutamate-ammonia-ligase adenylyltransferase